MFSSGEGGKTFRAEEHKKAGEEAEAYQKPHCGDEHLVCAPIVSCSHALRYHLRYGGGKAGGGYHKKTGVIGIDYLIVAHAYGAYGVIEGYAEYRTYYLYQQSGYAKYSRALYE